MILLVESMARSVGRGGAPRDVAEDERESVGYICLVLCLFSNRERHCSGGVGYFSKGGRISFSFYNNIIIFYYNYDIMNKILHKVK